MYSLETDVSSLFSISFVEGSFDFVQTEYNEYFCYLYSSYLYGRRVCAILHSPFPHKEREALLTVCLYGSSSSRKRHDPCDPNSFISANNKCFSHWFLDSPTTRTHNSLNGHIPSIFLPFTPSTHEIWWYHPSGPKSHD